jgi:hypothetical protein
MACRNLSKFRRNVLSASSGSLFLLLAFFRDFSTEKLEAVRAPETSEDIYQTTQCYVSEDSSLQNPLSFGYTVRDQKEESSIDLHIKRSFACVFVQVIHTDLTTLMVTL